MVATLSKKWKYPLGAVKAKEKALEAGVNFSRDVRIRDVEIETDSLEIFNAVQGLASPSSFVANVLARIMVQASFLRQCKFSHTKRQGNVSAHFLAQHTKFVEDYVAWLEECPSILEYVCAHDRLVFEHSDI